MYEPKTTRKIIEFHIDAARKEAIAEVERLAMKYLREHATLKEFVMENGHLFFIQNKKPTINIGHSTAPKYMKALEDLIVEWNDILHITGEPMRFTAYGRKITNW